MNKKLNNSEHHAKFVPHYQSKGIFITDEEGVITSSCGEMLLPIRNTIENTNLSIINTHRFNGTIFIKCRVNRNLLESQTRLTKYTILTIRAALSDSYETRKHQIIKAHQWFNWDQCSQYCGKCGNKIKTSFDLIEKNCKYCHMKIWPKLSPAVMILVTHGKKLLLARSPHFAKGVYSSLAGFIELGESAEMAACREIKEEVGIEISDLVYFHSQTWPFPSSFMVAFKAKYSSGEIMCNHEIEDAKWFDRNQLPQLPQPCSIAKQLIDWVIVNSD